MTKYSTKRASGPCGTEARIFWKNFVNTITSNVLAPCVSLVIPYGDRYGSTLAQVMAYCLTAPSHYVNQCWLTIKGVVCYSPESISVCISNRNAQELNPYNVFRDYIFKVIAASSRGQWVYWNIELENWQGAVSIRKTVLPGMAIPMLKIRRPNGRLIFNMEIAIRR